MTWLYTPSKSAPAWACLAKDCEPGSSTWASRCAPWLTWNGKPIQPPALQRAAKKEAWTTLLSGPTYSPSTLADGSERWTASLRASRAKTSVWRGAVLALMASEAGSFSTSSTLPTLAVRGSSFWRTSQASLLPPPPLWTKPKASSKSEQPPESWENWPSAGGTRNGSLFQRPTWAPAMGGSGGSALRGEWCTPICQDAKHTGHSPSGPGQAMKLVYQTAQWATTNAHDGRRPGADMASTQGANLNRDAVSWATPRANDAEKRGNVTHSPNMPDLVGQSQSWPTPRGTDGTKGGPNQAGSKGDLMLPSTAVQWPTPAARDGKNPNSEEHCTTTGGGKKHMNQLTNFVAHSSLPALQTQPGPESSSNGPSTPRRLNPIFVEWLMGWPSQWTKAEPSASSAAATALWRSRLQQHLSSLLEGQG